MTDPRPVLIDEASSDTSDQSEFTDTPKSVFEVFWVFTLIGIQSFGGATAVAQRELIDRRHWFTVDQFVAFLTVCQSLPGPNVCILAVMIGDRFFGLRGAAAGLLGILGLPLTVVSAAVVLFQNFSEIPQVQGALRGMAAVAAGMVLGSALKLTTTAPRSPLGLPLWTAVCACAFIASAVFHIALVWTLVCAGGVSIALAAVRFKKKGR